MRNTSRVSFAGHLFAYPRRTIPTLVVDRTGPAFAMEASDRDRLHTRLYQLKRQLLRSVLSGSTQPELFKNLSRAADRAAELAWKTESPLLVFPCLFEELTAKVRPPRSAAPAVIHAILPVDAGLALAADLAPAM